MIEWNELEASDFCFSVRDGTHASPKESSDGKKLITSRHLNGYRLDLDNAYLISQGDFDEVNKRSKVDQWDVLISMIGTVGEVYLEREGPDYAIKNMGLFKSRDEASGRWLYYYLQSPEAKAELLARCRGTTQKYVPLGELRKFPVRVPEDVRIRDAIVGLLATLDDKIELNRRMNETLEEMARALFRDWFVDFGPTRRQIEGATDPAAIMGQAFPQKKAATLAPLFPAKVGDDGLPGRWRKVSLKSLGNVVTGKTPSTKRPDFYGEDIPFLKIPDMHGKSYVLKTGSMLSALGASSQAKKTVPAGSVSVSCIATPGLVVLNHRDTQTNQQINTVVPNNLSHQYFTFWSCREIASEVMIGGSGGSVFHNMNKTTFENLEVAFPGNDEAALFGKIVEPLHQRILANEQENQTLAEMRDLLLPKLMSGEIRLKDVETAV